MYMVREVIQAQRGRAPEIIDGFHTLDQWFEQAGYTNRRLFVDCDGGFDRIVYQIELESLDQYFSAERVNFASPDPDTQALIKLFNEVGRSGYREIYEVIQ